MTTSSLVADFAATRLGIIMSSRPRVPHEAYGVLNPGGVRAANGTMYLFPRFIAKGNVSRIGHARVRYQDDLPVGVERLGVALEPRESHEGGVEDARVTYLGLLKLYVMLYTTFARTGPRVAVAVSEDLYKWWRLGLLRYERTAGEPDFNPCENKDATMFRDVVLDPEGVPSLAILHRPTTRGVHEAALGVEICEHIWISYVPIAATLCDLANLTAVRCHERVMALAVSCRFSA